MAVTIKYSVWFIAIFAMALTGCGADVASSAATAAAVKKQELEQGQKTLEQVQQKLDQTLHQVPSRSVAD